MLKVRLIPVLLLMNGRLVRSAGFDTHQIIGDPLHEVTRFNEWMVDELIYIDITRAGEFFEGRGDQKKAGFFDPLSTLDAVSERCFMPLTWGGRIRGLSDMRDRISRGADKITLNTAAVACPDLIASGARIFGSQAIVVSIDVRNVDGVDQVVTENGTRATGLAPVDWAVAAEEAGAGEILLQRVERDGAANGYDLDLISKVAGAVSIPVIACSGVGRYEDYAKGVLAGASAVAAANIWHFKEMADRGGKRALQKAGINVRI
jgi:imidazole glycerol-phosphate synthase subunit HisF